MYKSSILVERDKNFPSFIDLTNTSPIPLEIVFDDKSMEHFFAGPGETWNIDCGEREIADEILERRSFKVNEVSELRYRVLQLLDSTRWYTCSDGAGGIILRHITPSFRSFEIKWPLEDNDSIRKAIDAVEYCVCATNAKKNIRRNVMKISEEDLAKDAEAMAKECVTLSSLLSSLLETDGKGADAMRPALAI